MSAPAGKAADGAGYAWRMPDIREATVAIMLFTAVLAAHRLLRAADETCQFGRNGITSA